MSRSCAFAIVVVLAGCGSKKKEAAPCETVGSGSAIEGCAKDSATLQRRAPELPKFEPPPVESSTASVQPASVAVPPEAKPPAVDPSEQPAARAAHAVKEAEAAKQEVETAMKDLTALDEKVTAAITQVADAHNDAERSAAKAKLVVLQKEQTELKERMLQAKTRAEAAARLRGSRGGGQ